MQFVRKVKGKAHLILAKLRKKFDTLTGGNCAVLLYHRVNNLETDPQLLSVSPENFDAQLRYLKQNYSVLTIDEWQLCLTAKKRLPAKSVLITFDDGYADNFLNALPILESYQLQALFYICTANLNTPREFWWDDLERIILLNEKFPEKIELIIENQIISKKREEKVLDFYRRMLPVFHLLPPEIRDKKIDELAAASGNPPPRPSHRSLTFAELKLLSQSPFAVIGAHTHRHASLASLQLSEQREEIEQSLNILNKELSTGMHHFSYPFGTKNDYNDETIRLCKEFGLEIVCANFPWITHKGTDRFQIPRFLVRDWSVDRFALEMQNNFN